MSSKKIKSGDVFQTNEGGSVTVVEYRIYRAILVEHNDKHKHRALVRGAALIKGQIKNPYLKHVHGFGFFGCGKYRSSLDGEKTPVYTAWKRMLDRAYSKKFYKKSAAYKGVTVCNEWLDFQAFAAWWSNEPRSGLEGFHLDKDLRISGSKQYSPASCSFVPACINILLTDCNSAFKELPQGVRAQGKVFQTSLCVNGNLKYLGSYSTSDEAFGVYREAKERNVKLMANQWRDQLHPEVYANLSEWRLKY